MAAAFAAAPILTGVLVASTAVSAGLGIFGAIRSSQAAEAQAKQEEARETMLAVQGQQEQNQILEAEIDTLAAINVGAAASGVDPFTGAPSQAASAVRTRANRQLRNARLQAAFGINVSRLRQRQFRLQGQASLIGGVAGVAGSVGQTAGTLEAIGG